MIVCIAYVTYAGLQDEYYRVLSRLNTIFFGIFVFGLCIINGLDIFKENQQSNLPNNQFQGL